MSPDKIYLVGFMASGKSTVARRFHERNLPVIDADELAREAVAVGTDGLRKVVDRFGSEYDAHLSRIRSTLAFASSRLTVFPALTDSSAVWIPDCSSSVRSGFRTGSPRHLARIVSERADKSDRPTG